MNVGLNIKARRKELGINAETLAEKPGVSPSTVYRYESGHIEKIDSEKLITIAEALLTTPAKLMGWSDEVELQPINPDAQPDERPKWIKLSAGKRVLTDAQLDLLYSMAHAMNPKAFPLDDDEGRTGKSDAQPG